MLGDESLKEIRKIALKNAVDYGKADDKSVLSKAISKIPQKDRNIPEIREAVSRIVIEINSYNKERLEAEYGQYKNEFDEYEKARAERTSKVNMTLDGVSEGNFVTRFPPEPSGYMHIGHAKAVFLESEFVRIYKGKLWLYFDDTNAEKEKQEFVDAFKVDLKWLGIAFDKEYYASDNIEKMYAYAKELINKDGAYVCLCSADKIKDMRSKGLGCEHKLQDTGENLALWKKMIDREFEENQAILRFNGRMDDQNTAMRDPTLFRIKKHAHYRQGDKYTVWPTYDFNTPIMDSLNGVTDALRSKEYELRDELNYALLDMLGLRKPRIRSFSRFEIIDNNTHKREIRALISEGKLDSYDDPRLVTIIGLRNRGITPEAIKEFVLKSGMSKVESKVSMDVLLAENRRVVDGSALRLFAVEDPVELVVEKGDARSKLRLHPNKDIGFREYDIDGSFYISKKDAEGEKELRLKDLYDVRIISLLEDKIIAERVDGIKPVKIIQWVSKKESRQCMLEYIGNLMKDGEFNSQSLKKVNALAEGYVERLNEGDVVQFERIGYFKFAKKDGMVFFSL